MTSRLEHAEFEGVTSGPAPSKAATDRKKRGAGDFDEDKIKRDGRGRFAKFNSNVDEKAEEAWGKDIKAIETDIMMNTKALDKGFDAVIESILDSGYKGTMEELEAWGKENPDLARKSVVAQAEAVNKELERIDYSSPGGSKTVRATAAANYKDGLILKVVPRKSKIRHDELNLADFLEHYGTKGMRWGVRKTLQKTAPADRAAYLTKKDAKWLARVDKKPQLAKVSRLAARDAKKQTKQLKQEYKDQGINIKKDRLQKTRYEAEVKSILESSLDRASYKVHKMSPSRLREVQLERHPDGTLTARVGLRTNTKITKQQGKIAKSDAKRLRHADEDDVSEDDFEGLEFLLTLDSEGYVDDIITPFGDDEEFEHADLDDFLAHYGVRGMKWGVRRTDAELARASGSTKGGGSKSESESKGSAISRAKSKISSVRSERATKTASEQAAKAKAMVANLNISADAERVAQTLSKQSYEMSTREIKEANARLQAVEQYNQNFSSNPELKAKVEAMQLQKTYAQLQAEMNPTKTQRVAAYAKDLESAYTTFKKIDDASGGYFTGQLKSGLGKLKTAANTPATPKPPKTPKPPPYKPQHKAPLFYRPPNTMKSTEPGKRKK